MSSKPSTAELLQLRLTAFGARAMRVANLLPKHYQGQHISKQLTRSASSIAANYGEARAAESRSDFIHKLRIVLKELNETEVG